MELNARLRIGPGSHAARGMQGAQVISRGAVRCHGEGASPEYIRLRVYSSHGTPPCRSSYSQNGIVTVVGSDHLKYPKPRVTIYQASQTPRYDITEIEAYISYLRVH